MAITVAGLIDLATDPTFVYWHAAGAAMLVFMSVLCAILDHTLGQSQKCQPYKPTFSSKQYQDAIGVALVNGLLSHWPISLMLFGYWKFSTDGPTAAFDWTNAAISVGISAVVIDVWFYWTHRALHIKALYPLIHKKHHRFTAPCSLAAVYAHPLEFVIGNYMGVALGPCITGAHPSVGAFWFSMCIFGTCLTHSGYGINSAVHHHDMHHEFFTCNFGVSYGLDYLFGTDDHALGFHTKKEEKMAKFHSKKMAETAKNE